MEGTQVGLAISQLGGEQLYCTSFMFLGFYSSFCFFISISSSSIFIFIPIIKLLLSPSMGFCLFSDSPGRASEQVAAWLLGQNHDTIIIILVVFRG